MGPYLDIPPAAGDADTRGLLDHDRTRYKDSRLGRLSTGRFCPVHDWPVFRCPPRDILTVRHRELSEATDQCIAVVTKVPDTSKVFAESRR